MPRSDSDLSIELLAAKHRAQRAVALIAEIVHDVRDDVVALANVVGVENTPSGLVGFFEFSGKVRALPLVDQREMHLALAKFVRDELPPPIRGGDIVRYIGTADHDALLDEHARLLQKELNLPQSMLQRIARVRHVRRGRVDIGIGKSPALWIPRADIGAANI